MKPLVAYLFINRFFPAQQSGEFNNNALVKHQAKFKKLLWLLTFWLILTATPAAAESTHTAVATGIAAAEHGNLANAIAHWTQALNSVPKDALRQRSEIFIRRGEAYRVMGYYPKAAADFQNALQLARKADDPAREALALSALGNTYLLARNARSFVGALRNLDAEPLLQESLTLAEAHGLSGIAAVSANYLGNLYLRAAVNAKNTAANTTEESERVLQQSRSKQHFTAARRSYQTSLRLSQAATNPTLEVTARVNLARLETAAERFDQALSELRKAYAEANSITAKNEKAEALIAIGYVAQQLENLSIKNDNIRWRLSESALRNADALAQKSGDQRLISEAKGYLGALYEAQGRLLKANTLTEEAIEAGQRAHARDLLLNWEWQLGRLTRADGNYKAAIAAYRRAMNHIQAVRNDIPLEYAGGRSSFRVTLAPVYLEFADLLLQKSEKEKDPEQVQQLLKEARDTVELIKFAELQDYFKDACTGIETRTVNLEEIARRTAVLYPIIFPDRLELLVSLTEQRTPDEQPIERMYRKTASATVAEIEKAAYDLTDLYVSRKPPANEKALLKIIKIHALSLYKQLIDPIEPVLTANAIDTIVFVPDGALRKVPIAMLWDGSEYLIQRYAVATAPGLTLIDPQQLQTRAQTALLAGVSDSVQDLPGLPGVKEEINALSALLSGQTLLNRPFQVARFEQEVGAYPYGIVHIASHGRFGGTIEETFILTYDSKLRRDNWEGLLAPKEFEDEPVELLTLSACETAAGDDRAPLGLSGFALNSGARSSLATLWRVSDKSTATLVTEFYKRLGKSGISKAEALQQAQLRLLREPKYQHPYYWAPFILIGNWL